MKHIVIDVESLSIRTCPVITSFAAVAMSLDGADATAVFHANINIEEQIAKGSVVDSDTLLWWTKQDPRVFRTTLENAISPQVFCGYLRHWWHVHVGDANTKPEFTVWASDPLLDFGGIVRLHEANGYTVPWNHRQQRDARTLRMLVQAKTGEPAKVTPGTPHDALSDACALAQEIWSNCKQLGVPL